jgi:hypothetical protein
MVILYVETNFLMAIAKGQDLEANNLLSSLNPSIRIAIPDICYIEVLTRWEKEKYYVQQFEKEVDKQINNSKRDLTSSNAQIFLAHLEQARILNRLLLNDIQSRLFDAIDMLIQKAEIIKLDTSLIRNISEAVIIQPETLLIKQDIMDNLILKYIINHANAYPQEDKVFLSNNKNDFGKPEVRQALRNAGIDKYFSQTQDFIGWFQSQSS